MHPRDNQTNPNQEKKRHQQERRKSKAIQLFMIQVATNSDWSPGTGSLVIIRPTPCPCGPR
jgi:hypothetical protein